MTAEKLENHGQLLRWMKLMMLAIMTRTGNRERQKEAVDIVQSLNWHRTRYFPIKIFMFCTLPSVPLGLGPILSHCASQFSMLLLDQGNMRTLAHTHARTYVREHARMQNIMNKSAARAVVVHTHTHTHTHTHMYRHTRNCIQTHS